MTEQLVTAWVGFLHVRPLGVASPIGAASGGFATAVALASSRAEFEHAVEEYLADLQLTVVAIEDVETFAERLRTGTPDPVLVHAAATLTADAPVSVPFVDSYTEDPD